MTQNRTGKYEDAEHKEWKFTDEQLECAELIIKERKLKALSLNDAYDLCRESIDNEWSQHNKSSMEIIEEYESLTGLKIEEL